MRKFLFILELILLCKDVGDFKVDVIMRGQQIVVEGHCHIDSLLVGGNVSAVFIFLHGDIKNTL